MKTLLLLVCLAISSSGQNVALWFYGTNTNGVATNFPVRFQVIGPATHFAGADAVMSIPAAQALKSSTQASMDAFLAAQDTAQQAAAANALAANLQALSLSYSNLQWCADHWALATNVANLSIAVKACGDTLLKLKPILTDVYQRSLTQ